FCRVNAGNASRHAGRSRTEETAGNAPFEGADGGDRLRLSGKTAIVTGAARGIGRACALRLAEMGADVAIADINLAGAAEYGETLSAATGAEEIGTIGRRSIGIEVDLRDAKAAADMVAQASEALGPPDILVNVAGGAFTPIERSWASTIPEEDLDQMLATNL